MSPAAAAMLAQLGLAAAITKHRETDGGGAGGDGAACKHARDLVCVEKEECELKDVYNCRVVIFEDYESIWNIATYCDKP